MSEQLLKDLEKGFRERIEFLGYEYVGAELDTGGRGATLRIYADDCGGLMLDDCEKISSALNDYLDENEDLLPDGYLLEVSSPGLERPLFTLEDYGRFTGKEVLIRLSGSKKAAGIIEGVTSDGEVAVSENDGSIRKIPFQDIKSGNLVYKMQRGEKKTFKKIPPKKKRKRKK